MLINVNCTLFQLTTLLKTDEAIKIKGLKEKKKKDTNRSSGFGR